MNNKEMSFNKRILMVKKETFENITNSNELGKIAGSSKSGYYTLNTILSNLYPVLDKYDIDLDLEICSSEIIGKWYDCLSDKERSTKIDFSELREKMNNVKKLPMMANEVQSDGGVKSYIRRYAYTNILGLNATDIIENNPQPQQYTNNNDYGKTTILSHNGNVKTTPTKTNKKVSQAQLKRLFVIMNKAGQTEESVNSFIKTKFKKDSKKDLNNDEYKYLCDRLEMSAEKEATGDSLPLTTPKSAENVQPSK